MAVAECGRTSPLFWKILSYHEVALNDRVLAGWLNRICAAVAVVAVAAIGWIVLARQQVVRTVESPAPVSERALILRDAVLAERRGDLQRARIELERALKLKPDSPAVKIGLARLAVMCGDKEDAWARYRDIVGDEVEKNRMPIGGADTLAWYGDLADLNGLRPKSQKAYELASRVLRDGSLGPASLVSLSGKPGSLAVEAHLRAANQLLRDEVGGAWDPPKETLVQAIYHYRRALEIDSNNVGGRLGLADATFRMGERREAFAMLQKLRASGKGKLDALVTAKEKEINDLAKGIRRVPPPLPGGRSRTLPLPKR